MERHQRVLVGKNERIGWQNRKQSMPLCVVHNFYPIAPPLLEHLWRKYMNQVNYGKAQLQNAVVAVSALVKDNRSTRDVSALLDAKPCSCMKLYRTWPLYKINTTPTHVNAVSLIYTYISPTSALIQKPRCFRTIVIVIRCRCETITDHILCISEQGKALASAKMHLLLD